MGQREQAGAVTKYEPPGQNVEHTAAPTDDTRPVRQAPQEAAPDEGAKVPALHTAQVVALEVEKVPAAQDMHAGLDDTSVNLPAAHALQVFDPLSS